MRAWFVALLLTCTLAHAGKGRRAKKAAQAEPAATEQAAPRGPQAPAGVDWTVLHQTWLPTWGTSGRHEEQIVEELEPAPALLALFQQVSRLSWSDNVANFPRIATLFDQMNAWHEDRNLPWRYGVVGVGAQLGIRVFHVEHRLPVTNSSLEVLIAGRVDSLNVGANLVEWPEHSTVAIVPLRAVRNRTVAALWPPLDPSDDSEVAQNLRRELDLAVAEVELLQQLHFGHGEVELLQQLAVPRRTAEQARTAIQERARCSRFGVSRIPLAGFDAGTLADMAALPSTGACPAIRAEELTSFHDYRDALTDPAALESAIGALAAHALRPIVRLAAAGPSACPDGGTCDAWRAGLLAALSTPDAPVAASLIVCDLAVNGVGQAKTLEDELSVCDAPAGVADEAAVLYETEFGPALAPVPGLPSHLPVTFAGRP